jgi:hypothetical protein
MNRHKVRGDEVLKEARDHVDLGLGQSFCWQLAIHMESARIDCKSFHRMKCLAHWGALLKV